MDQVAIAELNQRLVAYESAASMPNIDGEMRAGIEMIVATVRRLIVSLEDNDPDKSRLESLTFSRQASDAYFNQPESFKPLAAVVGKVRKELELQ